MSSRSRSLRSLRSAPRILAALSLFAVGMTFAAPTVSAGGGTDLEWNLDNPGGDCVNIFTGSDVRDVLTDTAAMPTPDEPTPFLFPTGNLLNGTPISVVNIVLTQEFLELSEGFYLTGFRFLESCEDYSVVDPFEPCFSVSSSNVTIEPWILSFEPGEYLLFFFDLEQIDTTISIDVGLTETDCQNTEPDEGSGQIGNLLDQIDELDLEFDLENYLHFSPDLNLDFSLDPYIERVAAAGLPNTL